MIFTCDNLRNSKLSARNYTPYDFLFHALYIPMGENEEYALIYCKIMIAWIILMSLYNLYEYVG